jgi:hypothetical protein
MGGIEVADEGGRLGRYRGGGKEMLSSWYYRLGDMQHCKVHSTTHTVDSRQHTQ